MTFDEKLAAMQEDLRVVAVSLLQDEEYTDAQLTVNAMCAVHAVRDALADTGLDEQEFKKPGV